MYQVRAITAATTFAAATGIVAAGAPGTPGTPGTPIAATNDHGDGRHIQVFAVLPSRATATTQR